MSNSKWAKKLCFVLDVLLDILFAAVTVYNGFYSFQAALPSTEAVSYLFDCLQNGESGCAYHYWYYGDVISHGFWNAEPTREQFYSIEFRNLGRHRCVPLFQETSKFSASYGSTKYMFSSVPGRAFLGICTNAPLQEVNSIFGSQNRMFNQPVYDRFRGQMNWYPFAATSRACDCSTALDFCSANFTSFFSDPRPEGFDPVIFWNNFVFLNTVGGGCTVKKLEIRPNRIAADCSSQQGFYPVFYYEPTPWIAFFAVACAIQFIFCAFVEILVLCIAFRRGDIKDIQAGIIMSFVKVFIRKDGMAFFNNNSTGVLRIFYTGHLVTSGIVLIHLNLSGGCQDFPGRTQVIILLIINYAKLLKKDLALDKLYCCSTKMLQDE
jgi:hypothetical protein